MSDQNKDLLIRAASAIEHFDDWFRIEDLENELVKLKFDLKTTGVSRLVDYLLQNTELFKVKVDLEDKKHPVYLATFIGKPIILEDAEDTKITQVNISTQGNLSSINIKSQDVLSSISQNWKHISKLEA